MVIDPKLSQDSALTRSTPLGVTLIHVPLAGIATVSAAMPPDGRPERMLTATANLLTILRMFNRTIKWAWLLICATRAGNSVNREAPSRGPVLRPRGPMRSNDRREEDEPDLRPAHRRDRRRYPQIGKRSSRKGRASAQGNRGHLDGPRPLLRQFADICVDLDDVLAADPV